MSSPVLVSPTAPHLRCRCSAPVRPRRTSFALSFAHLLQLVFGRAGGCRHIAPTLVAPAAPRTRARRAGAAEDACLSCPDAFYGGFLSRAGSYVAGTDRPCSREAIGSVCTKLKAINVSIFARRSHVLVPPRPDLLLATWAIALPFFPAYELFMILQSQRGCPGVRTACHAL